jgi:hypothetical protein
MINNFTIINLLFFVQGETVEDDEIEQALASEFQLDDEEADAVQDEEDADTARGRITEQIEQQVNEAKEKLENIKVSEI